MDEQKLLRRRRKALKENNEASLVTVCTDLANLYVEEGRYDFAIEEYEIVSKIHQKQNKLLDYGIVNRGIGEAYLELRQFDKAIHHQKIYLEIAKQLGNKVEEQRALATIGHLYLTNFLEGDNDTSNLDIAYKFFTKSWAICENLDGEISKFEHADMSARLLSNLGLVQDCRGKLHEALELINKSINLCKIHDLYEQLLRGYVVLASLLEKQNDTRSALLQYNLAIETAKKLKTKPNLLTGVLSSKAEALIRLGDFQGAKSTLLKAYKIELPNNKEHELIERNLKATASICYNEDKLLTTKDTEYKVLKGLYEKIGDACCELKSYKKALDYYKKMLEAAIEADLPTPELASCYYSLGETHKDLGQYNEAINYFQVELDFYKDQLVDYLNTICKIIDIKEENLNCPIDEILKLYECAIERCRNDQNQHEEGRMVKRCIIYLNRNKQFDLIEKYQQQLNELNYVSSDSEGENSDTRPVTTAGDDIDIDDITDLSESSDNEQPQRVKRRPKTFTIKRNAKGETQLHSACINGKLDIVRLLLKEGHPVNVRDNCGWLPLHEACNWGHLDIVKLLLSNGATINDRGGTHCGGITPLHDAASNGHLEIVEFLLNNGANAIAKTDDGETVVDFLEIWHNNEQLNQQTESLYQTIIKRLHLALEKSGNIDKQIVVRAETSPEVYSGDLRRCKSIGLDDPTSTQSTSKVTSDYRNVIESLKNRPNTSQTTRKTNIKRPALITDDDDVGDNWLDDDIGKSSKKRRTNSPAISERSLISDNELIPLSEDEFSQENPSLSELNTNYSLRSKKSQSSLMDAGFNYTKTSPLKTQNYTINPPRKRKQQAKLTSFGHTRTFEEADSTSSPKPKKSPITRNQSNDSVGIEPTVSINVRINGKLYRIPILLSQVNAQTIGWLAEEAANRFAKKEHMKPTLELETKDGAVLGDDDVISSLFPMGATQAETIEGRIVKWNIAPLSERYTDICNNMNIVPDREICDLMETLSLNLNLSNRGLINTILTPLCKALNHQSNLIELNLSGNYLSKETVQYLSSSLTTLQNLIKLNLNCTGFTTDFLQIISNSFSDNNCKLTYLDLSDNHLNDESFQFLVKITKVCKLKYLNLSSNCFTQNLFNYSYNRNVYLDIDNLEELNLSCNQLNNATVLKIVSWLNGAILKNFDLSWNTLETGILKEIIQTFGNGAQRFGLEMLKLSNCHIEDDEIFDLLRFTDNLIDLNLSNNSGLTGITLKKLLENDKIINLNVLNCCNLMKYMDFDFIEIGQNYRQLQISLDCDEDFVECRFLINQWERKFTKSAVVEQSPHFLSLTVV